MQWKDLENDHNISLILKSSPNLELLVNQFNNPTLENIVMTLKKYVYLNIMTLTKYITLRYLPKSTHYPYSI